ncbi:hypothetical protein F2Q69_00007520 [Brassica cretica]|uniref:Uncharacterized protein n=1 Tax=Brassica cretica TaxID=69181 RepID=A0A8S9PB93_BRACR|nr:hypothetical protein F2Q69_00007520 [Brassica cretica]
MAVTGGDNHVEGKGSGNHERRENQTGKQGLENLSRGSEKGGSSWVEQIIKEGITEKEAETGGSVVIGKGNEGNKEGDDVVNKEKVGQQSIKSTEDIEEGEIVKDWLDVTPGKAGRGSNTLKYGQVGILTPSRFSALLEVDEKDEKEDTKEGEEVEGNMDEKSDKKEKGEEKDTEDNQNQGIVEQLVEQHPAELGWSAASEAASEASVVASVATEQ